MDKRAATVRVYRAIADGRLTRPDRCEVCGKSASETTQREAALARSRGLLPPPPYVINAHHEDYSKPLDVRWLCVKCHSHRHADVRAAAQARRWERYFASKEIA